MINLKEIIKEVLEEYLEKTLILKENVEISESLQYHIDNKMTLTNNIFRMYSEKYFDLVNEVRSLWGEGKISLNEEDTKIVESDLGKKVKVKNEYIYLDAPYMLESDEDLLKESINNRVSVRPKKFAVYVKTLNEGIKKVTFSNFNDGDGTTKKCEQKKDKTTAGYWSCNVSRYKKQLGLSIKNS